MIYHIVAGEEMKKLFKDRFDSIPFNEDLNKGSFCSEPFSEKFILERSAVHKVSTELYKEKLSSFLKMLKLINKDDDIHLYFGEDETCLANRNLLIDYLANKVRHLYLHVVDEYTGDEIKPVIDKSLKTINPNSL